MKNLTLIHGDFTEIAKICGLSISTVVGYYKGTLSVKPETEQKILNGWAKMIQKRKAGLKVDLKKATELKSRVLGLVSGINKAIEDIDAVQV